MKKVLVLVCLAIILVASVAAVSATWKDTETSKGNVIAAGSLDLKVNDKDDCGPAGLGFKVIDWGNPACHLPGTVGDPACVKVKNCGTCLGVSDIHFRNVVDCENTIAEPELPDIGPVGELSAWVDITITYDGKAPVTKKLSEWAANPDYDLGDLAAGQCVDVKIEYKINLDAPANTMTDSCTFDIEFTLHQK